MAGIRFSTSALVREAVTALSAVADPTKAAAMAAYMKTDMPFYGLQAPQRHALAKRLAKQFRPASQADYARAVRALWRLPHREEKYVAISIARLWSDFVTAESIELYEQLVREGQWWDLVDDVAIHLVGRVWRDERRVTQRLMDTWIDDDNLWIRRTALLGQNTHRADTDEKRLFRYCMRRADESEFFIRKAIGWALREYSYAAAARVRAFVEVQRPRLSGLSYREAIKALVRNGMMDSV
jgi:3-methyladenine DNA glycosylase AlkD